MAAIPSQGTVPGEKAATVSSYRRTSWLRWLCQCILGAAACGAIGVLGATAYFGSTSDALAFARGESLVIHPSTVLLPPAERGHPRVGKCEVKNVSGRSVHLIGSNACCGSRVTSGVPSVIEPGGTAWLEFSVYVGDGGSETISIYSDDGTVPELQVQLRAAGLR